MITLNTVRAESASSATQAPSAPRPQTDGAAPPAAIAAATVGISPLARLLADSAQLMESRAAGMSAAERQGLAEQAMNEISGPAYHARQDEYNNQMPKGGDAERLQLAASSTAFLQARQGGAMSAANPFSGLSREQLAAIVNDDSGRYTVNERRAADYAASDQEQAWRRQAVQAARAEYESTGSRRGFFEEVLRHYQGLPTFEQARYPSDYVEQLQNRIRLEPKLDNGDQDDSLWFPVRQLDNPPISNPQATQA
ncbi:hypothetical protein [Chromobacterium vaccinii]|uniref:Uncharacterized protein n=1 Tax=Chromobacterium vaccinii TaxID=1108595 RepID=A0A1D9LH78_9NEIS|nr:hypothetical protein [Chromobacterium vaccinii]AOZ50575.1 hypothetical protein BKX93_11650 [Chromobacterium vaccinii]